ncbi:hypothetical protein [Effusibacillus pohliae]|uniref:hypothetical protein n=1 Tax=Effusibacillus pohliae TaxID=232270 RepID=UPI00036B0290|nr:hypothetical protein [Effusibacillus pohliae]
MQYRRPQSYEERFLAVSTKLERLLFRLAITGFAGIVASQLALSVPEVRQVLSPTDRLEGKKISQDADAPAPDTGTKQLIIRPVAAQTKPVDAWVKVNGVPVAHIRQSEVVVKVKNHDKLEIDSSAQPGIFRFEIDHNDPSITSPTPGTVMESSQDHVAVIDQILIHNDSLAR